jgi:hypothetical protein
MMSKIDSKSQQWMGCCCSGRRSLQDEPRFIKRHFGGYTAGTAEWTLITEPELTAILNDINLSPIPDSRRQVLASGLADRLITCNNLRQILVLLGSDEERVAALRSLFGNVSDRESNWAPIYALFNDPALRQEAQRITRPANRAGDATG